MVSSIGMEFLDILNGRRQASATSSGCVSSSVMGSMSAGQSPILIRDQMFDETEFTNWHMGKDIF